MRRSTCGRGIDQDSTRVLQRFLRLRRSAPGLPKKPKGLSNNVRSLYFGGPNVY